MRQKVKDKIIKLTNKYYKITTRIGYPTRKSEYATIGFEKAAKDWAEQCEYLRHKIIDEVKTIQYMIEEKSQVNLASTRLLNAVLKYEAWLGENKIE